MVTEALPLPRIDLIDQAKAAVRQELEQRAELQAHYDWLNVARPEQLTPEGSWHTWLIMAGRGFGKTRTGAETIRQWVKENRYRHIALIANTETEARSIMVEGPSGLLSIHHPNEMPHYEPSKRRITWKNGAVATIFTAENYEQIRGAQFECVWIDEIAKCRHAMDMWDQMCFGLRVGEKPRVIVTTTPRPTAIMERLLAAEGDWVMVTRGTTFDNASNLAPDFIKHIKQEYEGTTLGEQELYGRVLIEAEGALWKYKQIDALTVQNPPPLCRIVVAVDPALTASPDSDETGIIVAGISEQGNAYVLKDLSGKFSPNQWASQAIATYRDFKADRIVAEVNQGGDMVGTLIRAIDPTVSFKKVYATRNKIVRAGPVYALYERQQVFHVHGLERLEEQMCTYVPGKGIKSPDRLDALVWALTELMLTGQPQAPPHGWLIR